MSAPSWIRTLWPPLLVLVMGLSALVCAPSCAPRQRMITKLVDGRLITTRSVSPRAYEHASRALIYEEEARWEEALREYRVAIDHDPRAPELHARMAEVLLELDRPKEAQEAIDKSLSFGPTVPGVMAAAHLHLHRGDPKAAARVLADALARLDPASDGEAMEDLALERADALLMALDARGARESLETLLGSRPASQPALYRQAAVTWAIGDFAAARRYLDRLIEIEPDHLEARLLLARLLTMLGEVERARAAYVEALARSEGDLGVASLYATFLKAHGHESEAETLAEDLQVNELDAETLSARMELDRSAGRLGHALELADDVLSTASDANTKGRILLAKGACLEASRRYEEAVRTFLAIPEDAGSFTEGRLRAVALLREQEQLPEAQALLQTVTDDALDEDMQVEATMARALLSASQGNLEAARKALHDVPPERADRDRLQLAEASVEDRYGDWRRALTLAEGVLTRDLGNAEALNFWAFVAAEHNHQLPLALERAQVALALEAGSAAILDTLGWIHHQLGQLEAAAPFLEGAARIAPDEPEIAAHRASLLARQGKIQAAASEARRALSLGPAPKLRGQLESLLEGLPACGAEGREGNGGQPRPNEAPP